MILFNVKTGHTLVRFPLSAEMQLVYSTPLAGWAGYSLDCVDSSSDFQLFQTPFLVLQL